MTVYGCGYNEHCPLGFDTKGRAVPTPTVIVPSWGDGLVQVSAQASHTCGFFADGHAEFVGGNDYDAACDGQGKETRVTTVRAPVVIGVPTARAFSMCESSGAVILPDGTVRTWGSSILGQAGNGSWSEGKERVEPPGVFTTPQTPVVPAAIGVVGGGQYHKLAITTAGQIIGWGRDDAGQLGDGQVSVKLVPAGGAIQDEPVIALDGGAKHSLFLRGDGRALGCGRGRQGQFGTVLEKDRLTPALIDGLEGVVALAAGGSSSLFLREDGRVFECGRQTVLHEVPLPGRATWVSAGTAHRGAVVDNQAFTWGANEWGQLGDGTREDKPSPVPTGVTCRTLDCGVGHTVFMV